MKILATVRGVDVVQNDDGSVSFGPVGMTIDADGAPHAYGPGDKGLDYLANAGHPGSWWGVATDAMGNPFIQRASDPAPGFYVSTTSYERDEFKKWDPRRYLNSETENFIVVPGFLRKSVRPVVLGCKACIRDVLHGETRWGVVGDFGPATHLGEASIAFAKALGVESNPKHGGTEARRFEYRFWPGVTASGYELQPA